MRSTDLHHRPAFLVAITIVSVLGAGCGSNADVETVQSDADADGVLDDRSDADGNVTRFGVTVEPESLLPPGTVLFDEHVVPDGTRLVGGVFPLVDAFGDEPPFGVQAVLVIDGDPVDVWNEISQFYDASGRVDATTACVVNRFDPVPRSDESGDETTDTVAADYPPPPLVRFLTEAPNEGENNISCRAQTAEGSAFLQAGVEEMSGRAVGQVFFTKKFVTPPPPILPNEEYVHYGTDPLRYERGYEGYTDTDADGDVQAGPIEVPDGEVQRPDLAASAVPNRLPGPGDRIDDSIDYYLDHSDYAALPDGVSSVMAPAMLIDCNSGLVAVVRSSLDPRSTIAAFGIDEATDRDEFTSSGVDDDGTSWNAIGITSAGGYYIDMYFAPEPDTPTFMLYLECGD